MNFKNYVVFTPLLFSLYGCMTSELNTIPSRKSDSTIASQALSVASAQRISRGMSSKDVLAALGTPNLYTKSKNGNISWVYDKMWSETESVQLTSDLWIFTPRRSESVSISTQKTFIVVIDFDANEIVKDVTYRQTSY